MTTVPYDDPNGAYANSTNIDGEITLDLGIPQGIPGHNPNRGTYMSDGIPSVPSDIEAGDFIVVLTDDGQGNVSGEIYTVKNNAWTPTGRDSNDAYFHSGELLSTVDIDDTHLENPSTALAKAEDARALKVKLTDIDVVEEKLTTTETVGYRVKGSDGDLTGGGNDSFGYTEIELGTDAISVRFLGLILKSSDSGSSANVGYAFGHYNEDVWVTDEAVNFEFGQTNQRIPVQIEATVPSGATHVRTTTKYYTDLTHEMFYLYETTGKTITKKINEAVSEARFSTNEKLSETGIDSSNLENPSNTDLALAKDVTSLKNSLAYKLDGIDGEVLDLVITQTLSNNVVTGHDVTYDETNYEGGDFAPYGTNNFAAIELEIGDSETIVFYGIDLNSNPTSTPLKDIGYAFGHYESDVWVCDSVKLLERTERQSSYELHEYKVTVPNGATHFRTMQKVFSKLTSSNFYAYGIKGNNVVQLIDNIEQQIINRLRTDLIGKKYCNMSASTFSYPWHGSLVEAMGMSYNNIGMGGTRYRMKSDSHFSLTYQTDEGAANRVMMNEVGNILTQHLNNAYYPNFIVSCAVLNDCEISAFLTDGQLDDTKITNLIGTAEQAMEWEFPNYLNCSTIANIASSFETFITSDAHRYNAMFCMRVCLQLLVANLPLTQIICSSAQYVGNPSYSNEVSHYFTNEQKKLCKMMSIPYINLRDEIGINEFNYTTYLGNDNLHPNNVGFSLYTEYMHNQLLQKLVVRNIG